MSLRFGHVFSITILAPDSKGDILKTVFRYEPIKNNYGNVDDKN